MMMLIKYLKEIALWSALVCFCHSAAAESMTRMGGTLEEFMISLQAAGALSSGQTYYIINSCAGGNFVFDNHYLQRDSDCAQEMRNYLLVQVLADVMSPETARYIAGVLGVDTQESMDDTKRRTLNPVPADYEGNGNVEFLGSIDAVPSFLSGYNDIYNGIWGYTVGSREYVLQCHSAGLVIIDITDASNPFRVQLIRMEGGTIWRDVDIYRSERLGRTFAYVGAQSGGNMWVVDLTPLSGTTPHIYPPIWFWNRYDRGFTDYGHTIYANQELGLLFLNSAASGGRGCTILDVERNPAFPRMLSQYGGYGFDCHDTYARAGVTVPGLSGPRDLLYAADGYSGRYRVVDITDIRSGGDPVVIGESEAFDNAYGHSVWLSDDSNYLYVFDEFDAFDMAVLDVSDPVGQGLPLLNTFQYSEEATADATVHNGQVLGNHLIVAYYAIGLRVFDISDPMNIVETGKLESYRDPTNSGEIGGRFLSTDGGWNVYSFFESGKIALSDTESGTFILRLTDA